MRIIRWVSGAVLAAGAALALFLATANAQSGWAIFEEHGTPVVLTAAQKTAAGNWAATVWPTLTPGNLISISCHQPPPHEGRWQCLACETVTLTDAEFLDAELAGQPVDGTVQKCYAADTEPEANPPRPVAQLMAAQVTNLLNAARSLGGLAADDVPVSVLVARTTGRANHVTATVNRLATLPPDQYRLARAKGDQPGGVAKLVGKVQ